MHLHLHTLASVRAFGLDFQSGGRVGGRDRRPCSQSSLRCARLPYPPRLAPRRTNALSSPDSDPCNSPKSRHDPDHGVARAGEPRATRPSRVTWRPLLPSSLSVMRFLAFFSFHPSSRRPRGASHHAPHCCLLLASRCLLVALVRELAACAALRACVRGTLCLNGWLLPPSTPSPPPPPPDIPGKGAGEMCVCFVLCALC